jgi:hypothetical protein
VSLRIFRYYKELVAFHMACDPAQLLKHVSPQEADMFYMDAAMGIHVRFRLGGTSFPPTLYYKVRAGTRGVSAGGGLKGLMCVCVCVVG